MFRRTLLVAIVTILPFVSPTLRAADSTPTAKSPLITATGRVLDPAGKSLPGARVILREWSSLRYSEDVYGEASDILAETTSDADGSFRFESVSARPFKRFNQYAAPWDIVALAPGFGPAWLHLKQSDSPQPLEIKLAPAQSMSGQLIDVAGEPIADCQIELVGIDALGGPTDAWRRDFDDPQRLDLWRSQAAPSTKTNAEGRFELTLLPADRRLTLRSTHPQFLDSVFFAATTNEPQPAITMPSVENGKQVNVDTPIYLSGFQHLLKPGCQVRGRVVRADTGEPEMVAKISLNAGNRSYIARADKNGDFALTGLPIADFELSAYTETAGYLGSRQPISFTPDNREQEVTIQLVRGEAVSGRVVDAETGAGVAGIIVSYVPPNAQEESNWSPARPATTDPRGEFELFIPSGKLRVGGGVDRHPTHDVPDFWRWREGQKTSSGHSAAIDVKPREPLDDVRLTVTRGLIVRGQAVNSAGEPIALAKVESADRHARSEFVKKTITDEAGRFELAGFPPYDELQLKLTDAIDHLRGTAQVDADPSADTSRTVDLGPIELRGTATVTGTVLGDGQPLAGARVSLNVVTGRDGPYSQSTQDQVVTTDTEGRFTLDNVDPARESHLWITCDGYTDASSHALQLKPGETRTLDPFQVKSRSASVAGIVVDPDGNPVPGVTVSASQRDGGSISFGRGGPPQPTGPDGRFRLDDLPNVPLELLAYIRAPEPMTDRTIHFPARVNAEPGQTDTRILLDPKLQRPLP